MGGFHYWKGGDDDPRDQVGVDPTTPAPADAEPVHPVWGYPFPGAGPPDLKHAIQAATEALLNNMRPGAKRGPFKDPAVVAAAARVAVEAAAPVLLQAPRDEIADLTWRLHEANNERAATRDRLADLQGEYELTKARFNDFAEEAFERNRQHVVQMEELDRVVSLANAERNEARDRLADLEAECAKLRSALIRAHPRYEQAIREALEDPGEPITVDEFLAELAALDGPAAQEEGG